METVIVAVIGAAGLIMSSYLTSGRHLRGIRKSLDPGDGKSLIGEIREIRADLMALGVLFGQHVINDHGDDPLPPSPKKKGPHP